MKNEILRLKEEFRKEITDKRVLWDFLKMKISNFTRKYSKVKARQRKERIDNLEKDILSLERELIQKVDKEKIDLLECKRSDLRTCYDYVNEGIKIRSRAAYCEKGERDTRYFTQLMQSNKRKTLIRKLLIGEKVSFDQNEIIQEIHKFYSKLYAEPAHDNNMLHNNVFLKDLPKLESASRELCEGKLTHGECWEALKQMKLNKTPGNDGLSVEFYLLFWPILGDVVVEALNETLRKGELSSSQKQAVIILFCKDGKDPSLIKNYRPISLLNVDYKILAKVLSIRIKKVLHEVIYIDQVGYIKGRYIGEAIRLIDDMIFHTTNNNIPGFLMAIDFEKAFDSVSRTFLQNTLRSFGFGPSFCRWIKTLYNGTLSCVFNGGISTGYFSIEKGVRQGDPLSPYLFILCIEILAYSIRKDSAIRGIRFGDIEVKQVLYADDMTLFVRDSASINRIEKLFECFAQISGLKINRDKTFILPLGPLSKENIVIPFGKLVDVIKILGITFSLDVEVQERINYKEILSKIKRMLTWWKQRDLTLMGKIQLIKTFVLSKLNYVSSLTPVPPWVFEEVEKSMFDFLWNGKDKIKRNVMFLDYDKGGLKMIDFHLFVYTQRIMWIKRLILGDSKVGWKRFFKYKTREMGGLLIFFSNISMRMNELSLPRFYKNMLEVWVAVKEVLLKKEAGKRNEIIFNNKFIRLDGHMFFDEGLFLRNVYKLHHLVDDEGKIKSIRDFQRMGLSEVEIRKLNQLFENIPVTWKGLLKKSESSRDTELYLEFIFNGRVNTLVDVTSKKIYTALLNIKLEKSYAVKNLERIYNYSEKEIQAIFLRPRKSTLNSRLREFQFKFLYELIYTRKHMYTFKLSPSNICSFCDKDEETYEHLFFTCEKIRVLWKDCGDLFKLLDIKNINWEGIYIGVNVSNIGKGQFINHIILLIKYMIFVYSRGKNKPPTPQEIKQRMLENEREEKKLAEERGTLTNHLKKWENFHRDGEADAANLGGEMKGKNTITLERQRGTGACLSHL